MIFLFIHNQLTLIKWCYTPLQNDFALDPIIPWKCGKGMNNDLQNITTKLETE